MRHCIMLPRRTSKVDHRRADSIRAFAHPARNEGGNVGKTLDHLRERLDREKIDYEIIIIDDGSTDSTSQEVECRQVDDSRIRLIHNNHLHGYGRAVRLGLEQFVGDAVVITMADGSDDPEDVVKYFYVLRDRAECAFGSRWVQGGTVENYPKFKYTMNRMANYFIQVLFGVRYNDVTNAFKGYRANVIAGCKPLWSPHFNLTVEIPLKAVVRGYSYEVIPIGWRNRELGQSSLRLKEMGSRYLYIVLNIWLERMLTKDDYFREDGLKK